MNELLRRAAPGLALAGLALSTVWVFDPALQAARATQGAAQADPAPTVDGAAPAQSDSAAGTPDTNTPDTTAPDTNTQPDSNTEPPASSDCSHPTMVAGDAAMTRWGPVQVQMEFAADGTVCGVEAVVYPDGDHHSAELNSRAVSYLDAQAAQSGVAFDTFSGATYTSEAYRESMQSILDQR